MAVSPADVAVELGRPTPTGDTLAQWESWIVEARYLIGRRLGDINALNQGDVDYVVKHAVADHIRNPDSATQVDVAVDDARVSRRYTSGAGRVTILDEWWSLLTPQGGVLGGAYSIPLGSPWSTP